MFWKSTHKRLQFSKRFLMAFLLTAALLSSCHSATHRLSTAAISPGNKENAARYYEAAAQAIVPLEEKIRKQNVVFDQIIQNGWAPETAAPAAELLKESDFALSLFQQGTGIPAADFNFPRKNSVKPQISPSCLELKLLTNLLLVKAKQMESSGESSSAVNLYISALQFVYHLGQDPQTISKVTALTLEKNINLGIRQAAEKKILSAHDRNVLRDNFLKFQKARFRASGFVDVEQTFFLEMVSSLAEEAKNNAAAKDFPSQRLIQKAGLLSGQYNDYWRRALETNASADWEKANAETKLLKTRAGLAFPNIAELTGRLLANTLSGKTEETEDLFLDQTVTYLYVVALPNYHKMSELYRDSVKSLEATIQLLS